MQEKLTRRQRYFKYPVTMQGLREVVEEVKELQTIAASIVGGANPFSKEVMSITTEARAFIDDVLKEAHGDKDLLNAMERGEDILNTEIGGRISHAIAKMGHLEKRMCEDFEKFFDASVHVLADHLLLIDQYLQPESARMHAKVQGLLATFASSVRSGADYDDLVQQYSVIYEILEPVYGPLKREVEEARLQHEIRTIREKLGLSIPPAV